MGGDSLVRVSLSKILLGGTEHNGLARLHLRHLVLPLLNRLIKTSLATTCVDTKHEEVGTVVRGDPLLSQVIVSCGVMDLDVVHVVVGASDWLGGQVDGGQLSGLVLLSE